jgi:cyclohexanone monooxygenase
MFSILYDILYNEDANKEAQNLIKSKIRKMVKDPVKAERLIPKDRFVRRPLCDTRYYQKFSKSNIDNVDI